MNIIQHIVDPKKLLLVWKPPIDRENIRSNRAVGKIESSGGDAVLTYLDESDDFHKAEAQGFHGHPAFPLKKRSYLEVMRVFMRRLPPRDRSDFSEFLQFYRLPAHGGLSDFALLANTGGKLPRDGFSVVPDMQSVQPPYEMLLEVAGFRHQSVYRQGFLPKVNDAAFFRLEPNNPYDPNAIQIFSNEHPIGYVNRLQTGGIKQWLDGGKMVTANIDRINGTPDRPVIYLFLAVK